jgi:hypothetical protein
VRGVKFGVAGRKLGMGGGPKLGVWNITRALDSLLRAPPNSLLCPWSWCASKPSCSVLYCKMSASVWESCFTAQHSTHFGPTNATAVRIDFQGKRE